MDWTNSIYYVYITNINSVGIMGNFMFGGSFDNKLNIGGSAPGIFSFEYLEAIVKLGVKI